MKKALAGAALAALLSVSTAAHAVVMFDFSTHGGNVGTSEVYTDSGAPGTPLTVEAKGFDAANAATAMYGKQGGGDENGLGLANDPSGENEIALGKGRIQLDIGSFLPYASSLSAVSFNMGSTTDGETWSIYGSNADGTLGSLLFSGSDELAHLLPSFGNYRYYSFLESASSGGRNILLGKLTANVIGTPFGSGVPEPSTWIMMMLGFGVIGAVMRRKTSAVTRRVSFG